jgi:hypothetical protein
MARDTELIHEHIFQSPLSTHSFIEWFIAHLKLATPQEKKRGPESQGGATPTPHWILPLSGSMKVNVDAALSKNSCTVTMAIVARDEACCFLRASVIMVQRILNAETAKVMVCKEGFCLASDLMLRKVIIATDWLECNEEHTRTRDGLS